MDSKKKGIITGIVAAVVAVGALVGAAPISQFGFDATAWYSIASVQIVSALIAVSYFTATDRDE